MVKWHAMAFAMTTVVRCFAADLIYKEGRSVEVIKANTVQPAVVGLILLLNDKLATGDSSRAVLRIRNSWNARVDEKTLIQITDKGVVALDSDLLILTQGRALIYSREQKGEWRIQTPAGTGIGRGTQLLVQVFPGGRTFMQVLEGEVDFANALGRVVLNRGEAGEAAPGIAPRKTAVIETRTLLQWALYYPAVLEPDEIGLTAVEREKVRDSLAAYEQGDLPGALDKYPAALAPVSAAEKLYRAAVLLATGQVDAARQLLAGIPGENSTRRALERMLAAVLATPTDAAFRPTTASEAIAESYFQQSQRRLPLARTAAVRATMLAPRSGFAWTRLAEMEFSFGRTNAARLALEQGLRFSPRNAQAHALHGYLLSATNRIGDARAAFERAIQLDGALGNAWLGLGLTKIKQGQLAAGRLDLQTAATVEPTRAFFHSYHAKALSAEDSGDLAAKEFELAKQLDAGDPTPWLYSAIEKLQTGRPNAAIDDLQQSLRLSDHRQVYRSAFLLDQDRAVRSANLAQIYRDTGMNDLAVREATRAVESDYTSASAHLFLAHSFDTLRDPTRLELRHETAWFNELLLANLLAPVGGGPLSQFISQQEYSKLLESDGMGASSVGQWRSDGRRNLQASVFATYGRVSFGLDFDIFDQRGTRTLTETLRREAYAQIKYQPGADDIVYSLVKWMGQDNGDIAQSSTIDGRSTGRRYKERQKPGLLLVGWNRRWAPAMHTLLLGGLLRAKETIAADRERHLFLGRNPSFLVPGFLRPAADGRLEYTDPILRNAVTPPVSRNPDGSRAVSDDFARAIAPFLGGGPIIEAGFDVLRPGTQREFSIYLAELQHLWQTKRNTLIAGIRCQSGDFEARAQLNVIAPDLVPSFASPAADDDISVGFQRQGGYAYDFLTVMPQLTLIAGASWDRMRWPENFRLAPLSAAQSHTERTNAKAGFTFSPHPALRIRGVYTKSLGGVSFDESVRLEPVQLAGFVQTFRTVINEAIVGPVEAPVYTLAALSIGGTLPGRTWANVAFSRLDEKVARTRGAFDVLDAPIFAEGVAAFPSRTREQLAYREDEASLTFNQLIGSEVAIGAAYRHTRGTLRQRFPDIAPTVSDLADQRVGETLQRLSFTANWNSPHAWFSRAEATGFWQRQENFHLGRRLPEVLSVDFWRLDFQLGYRFHRNRREISAGVLNLTDRANTLRPLTGPRELTDERTAFVRYRVNL